MNWDGIRNIDVGNETLHSCPCDWKDQYRWLTDAFWLCRFSKPRKSPSSSWSSFQVLTVMRTVLYTVSVHYGTERHERFLEPTPASLAFKWNLLGQVLGILGSTFARLAFIMTILTILSPQQRVHRLVLLAINMSQILLNVSVSMFIILQCRPTSRLWNHSIPDHCPPPEAREYFEFVQGGSPPSLKPLSIWANWQALAINSVTDLLLATIPVTVIWKLNMRLYVKITLCLTMGLGVL